MVNLGPFDSGPMLSPRTEVPGWTQLWVRCRTRPGISHAGSRQETSGTREARSEISVSTNNHHTNLRDLLCCFRLAKRGWLFRSAESDDRQRRQTKIDAIQCPRQTLNNPLITGDLANLVSLLRCLSTSQSPIGIQVHRNGEERCLPPWGPSWRDHTHLDK